MLSTSHSCHSLQTPDPVKGGGDVSWSEAAALSATLFSEK